jgi:hypothetical protein
MRISYGRVQGSGYNACTGKYCIICPGAQKKNALSRESGAQEVLFDEKIEGRKSRDTVLLNCFKLY